MWINISYFFYLKLHEFWSERSKFPHAIVASGLHKYFIWCSWLPSCILYKSCLSSLKLTYLKLHNLDLLFAGASSNFTLLCVFYKMSDSQVVDAASLCDKALSQQARRCHIKTQSLVFVFPEDCSVRCEMERGSVTAAEKGITLRHGSVKWNVTTINCLAL